MRLMLYGRADPNRGTYLKVPLHVAARQDSEEIARALLEAWADPNVSTTYAGTPLHLAGTDGCLGVARLLLQARANPGIQAGGGTTYEEACSAWHAEVAKLIFPVKPEDSS